MKFPDVLFLELKANFLIFKGEMMRWVFHSYFLFEAYFEVLVLHKGLWYKVSSMLQWGSLFH